MANGKVEIDGRAAGFAPLELKLTVGVHQVLVRDLAGKRVLLQKKVTLGPEHTRTNPKRIIR